MEKLVYNVFKAIIISMLLIFAFDILCYLWRAFVLKGKIENMMSSMQTVVSENNYLPAESYQMYVQLATALVNEMNGAAGGASTLSHRPAGARGWFVDALGFNYDDNAVNCLTSVKNSAGVNVLVKKMETPAKYGDIMVVQCRVLIEQPSWGFTGAHQDATTWDKKTSYADVPKTEMQFTYYVPCLNYRKAM